MASEITLKDQFIWVSNGRLFALLDFAIEVGESLARDGDEREIVARLRRFSTGAYPGITFDLGDRFPTVDERKWWARVFNLVAHRIYLRQLGNQDSQGWQPSAIGDAYVVARMLTRAVQEVENGWHPVVDDPGEAEDFTSGPMHVRN
jgi:hypothetical protein